MARVVIENLSRIFPGAKGEQFYAVNKASLAVEDKEFLVLVGPSGCGKSTTLRMIAGLEDVSEGTVSIDDRVVNAVEPKDRDIAMVFQNYALYPHMTVFENMGFGLKLRKFPRPEIERRVREAADILGLTPYLDRRPKALSGGERQRVAVGRAIVRKPKVFLFDEPLSNLDAPLRAQMRLEIAKLHTRLEATMIYVTHDQVEAMTMGDRIAVMRAGVIQQVADPLSLYYSPASLFVAGFIGSPPMNFFTGTMINQEGRRFFVGQNGPAESASADFRLGVDEARLSRLPYHAGKKLILGIRPEHIEAGRPELRNGNTIAARIEVAEPLGSETYLHLTSGAHSFVARIPGGEQLQVNQSVLACFDVSKAHFFDPVSGLAIK